MNPVIRAQLREFAKANSLLIFGQEKQFEIYSIFSVVSGLLGENVDAYDIHLDGDEFGVDGVGIIIQGEVVKNRVEAEEKLDAINNPSIEFVFFQTKTSTSYDYGDISKFFDAVSGFFDGSLKEESETVDDLIGAMEAIYERGVGKKNPRISCYYVATGNYEQPARVEKLRQNFRTQLEEMNIFEPKTITIEMVGARDLQQWYRAATSAIEVEIDFPRNVVLPSNSHVEEAYIGYIDAENLLPLYVMRDGNNEIVGVNKAVFFDNIRDYDSKSKINISIKDSVKAGGGAEFVFRNNGITVVSKNIDRTGDRFRLEDFQIVNGCQTSNVIYDLIYGDGFIEGEESPLKKSIQVPFRLIGSKDDEFVSSIIVGTNRQNPVRDEQFWALRPFMKSFEEYCRNLESEEIIYFERRDNQYRNQDIERTRVMQPSVLMKAVAAFLLFQPQRAARDYRGILSEYENVIFLDDQDVRIYHAVAYLYYRLEFLWRNQKIDNGNKTFRYYILTGIGLKATKGKNVFTLKKAKIASTSDEIISIAKDEEALKASVTEVVHLVERRLRSMSVTTQEKIRDTIRSESFAAAFRDEVRLLANRSSE
ncbi:AIPR family protein [Shinella kummerowiae]|uniref:AIPR family protein n=1 Tax=Shinella kummerowiae TaxID=417745 RepID=UPI0021B63DF1|nr:AIPR family protein [Shinella kummerowiae]MCT7666698.1 AIPR family protein [Shinella kummerowiae]